MLLIFGLKEDEGELLSDKVGQVLLELVVMYVADLPRGLIASQ